MADTRMRVLVCGGREYAEADKVASVLDRINDSYGIAALIEGGANGADRLAADWAMELGIPVETFEADWRTHGRAAGPIRNKRMITKGRPDLVVAFPGGRGTTDMVRQAKAAGVEVWRGTDGSLQAP